MATPRLDNAWASSPRTPLEDVTSRANNTLLQPLPSKCKRKSYLVGDQGEYPPQESQEQHAVQKRPSAQTSHYPMDSYETQCESSRIVESDDIQESIPSSPVPDIGEEDVDSLTGDGQKAYIGPWRLRETLGQGAAGIVRRCVHRVTHQEGAVKVVSKRSTQLVQAGSLNDLDQWDRGLPERDGELRIPVSIEREVAILKLIQHPNIVKLYDIWESHDQLYLVLEYIDGGDLFGYITKHGRLSEEGAITYFRQMMSAISNCHSFNICHRDLKPENILIAKGGSIKIADFSMAALHQHETHNLETACGSPHYAAPELLSHRPYKGDKADIWSLGCILYAMLASSLPFDHHDHNTMLDLVRCGEYTMPEFLSVEAKDLIRRLLQVNPKRRITMKEMWRHPLILKYSYMDDCEEAEGRSATIRDAFRYEAHRLADLDPQLLRQMQSLWHFFSKEDLIERLTSTERSDHKIFYWLLTKYREDQVENFNPVLAHSLGDYHHMNPSLWKKRMTSCDFPRQEGLSSRIGHSREASRITVVSHVLSTSDAETIESYDPFNSDHTPLPTGESGVSRTVITIHRSGNRKSSKSRANSNYVSQVAQLRRGSAISASSDGGSRYTARHAGIVRVHTSISSNRSTHSGRSSRGSRSCKSTRSGPYVRTVAIPHRRGVDFSLIHNRTRNGRGGAQGKGNVNVAATKAMGNAIGEGIPRQDSDVLPVPWVREAHKAVPISPEELSCFKSSIEEDIDRAFGHSLIEDEPVAGSTGQDQVRRRDSTPLTLSFGPNSVFASTPAPDRQNWLDRPLPPLPSLNSMDTPSPSATGVPNRLTRDSTGDNLHRARKVVRQVNNRLSLPLLANMFNDRRIVSAPEKAVAPSSPESPSMSNKDDLHLKGKGKTSTGQGGCRFSSAPQPELTHYRKMEQKDLEYLSQAKKTIRLVESSAVQRTRSNPFNHRRYVCPEPSQPPSHQLVSISADDKVGPGGDDKDKTVTTRGGRRVHKKKAFWLKRRSYDSNASISSSIADVISGSQPRAVQFVSQTAIPTHSQNLVPLKKRSSFIPSLFKSGKKPTRDTAMAIADQEQGETSFPDEMPAEIVIDPNADARKVSVRRNWLVKLFNIQPHRDYICFAISSNKVRHEILNTLRDWRKYGIRGIYIERKRNTVFAEVGPNNYLGMKPVTFAAEVMAVLENGRINPPLCIVRFTQQRGAASSFHRVVDAMKGVFDSRNILVEDKTRISRMVETAKIELELRTKTKAEVEYRHQREISTDNQKISTRRFFPRFRK